MKKINKRRSGYYWVKLPKDLFTDIHWEIAHYDATEKINNKWTLCGEEMEFADADFMEIREPGLDFPSS